MKKLRLGATFASRWANLVDLFRIAEAWFFFNEPGPLLSVSLREVFSNSWFIECKTLVIFTFFPYTSHGLRGR